jgi:uncharacterized protein (DUF433 family)
MWLIGRRAGIFPAAYSRRRLFCRVLFAVAKADRDSSGHAARDGLRIFPPSAGAGSKGLCPIKSSCGHLSIRRAIVPVTSHAIPVNLTSQQEILMANFDRITQRPDRMGGKPCLRGMRVTVGMVVGMVGGGHSIEAILADYPYLEREDVLQMLRYAAWRADDREILLATG